MSLGVAFASVAIALMGSSILAATRPAVQVWFTEHRALGWVFTVGAIIPVALALTLTAMLIVTLYALVSKLVG